MTVHLDANSKVTVGLVLALVVPLLTLAAFIWSLKVDVGNARGEAKEQIGDVQVQVDDVKHQLASMKDDRFGLSGASEAALREAIENPGHRVPDPRNPGQVIVVKLADIRPGVAGPSGGGP